MSEVEGMMMAHGDGRGVGGKTAENGKRRLVGSETGG